MTDLADEDHSTVQQILKNFHGCFAHHFGIFVPLKKKENHHRSKTVHQIWMWTTSNALNAENVTSKSLKLEQKN